MKMGATWPAAADPDAAERLIERFAETGDEGRALAAGSGRAMLAALGGGSPFLSDLALREHRTVLEVMRSGPDAALEGVERDLAAVQPTAARSSLSAALRGAKRRGALITAMADIGGFWGLGRVTGVLSWLAETALRRAVDHLLLAAHRAQELALPNPAHPGPGSGLVVLGMGKLGARELNYSSDIDLVLLYDPETQRERDGIGAAFTRLARNLVTIMEARDAEGYVFRTDLRLRPDPAATPPAVALPAALTYYESMGQNWERAAMTKARPVAGDIGRGYAFLREIRPFVWRRGLDFAAIADIAAMKRRINAHRGLGGAIQLAGHDVKLGSGGIREIEFAAQTLQLVWGGRNPGLRDPTTLGGLKRLARAGLLARRAAAELTVAYRVLRRVEHRLQMVADRQTHALPSKAPELERFAVFFGCADTAALSGFLQVHMDRVRQRYGEMFEAVPEPPAGVGAIDLTGMDNPPATVAALEALGFRNTTGVIATLRGWQSGRLRAMRSHRSRELMEQVLPSLLAALGDEPDPDLAFMRFDQMLSRQPAGVQLLSMFQRNPALLDRVAAVLGAAPSLADHLATVPSALEGLLAPNDSESNPAETLRSRLQDAHSLEDVVAIMQALVRAEDFRLCVGQMEGWLSVDSAGVARTALADAVLAALLPAVLQDHASRYGTVRGGGVAVVALGKAGSREMMAGSDLDLMLVYDHPSDVTQSEGAARSLPAPTWFIRAAHAFVAALTAPGREGPLYSIDMRLRPSGNKGPVAVSLEAFRKYHLHDAWTWERMALTRARVVTGTPEMVEATRAAIAAALTLPREPARTRADAASMRARLLRDLPPSGPWDVKLRPGGGIEVDFIAQTLQLIRGACPGCQTTRVALAHLAEIGAVPPAQAAMLIGADRLWRTVQSMLRILVGRSTQDPPSSATGPLLRAIDPALDVEGLRARLDQTAQEVREAFVSLVGEIA
jgi:glutamate-ammonia-ligase adenylyltransferase